MLKEYLIGRVAEAKAVQAKLPGIKEDEVGSFIIPRYMSHLPSTAEVLFLCFC